MTHHPKPDPPKGKAEDELLPCPFDHEIIKGIILTAFGIKSNYVMCLDCLYTTKGYPTKEKAIAVWQSRRAPSPSPAPSAATPETEAKVEGEGLKAVEIRFNMTNAPDGSYYPAAQVEAALGELHGKLNHEIEKAFSLAEAVGRQHKEIQSLSSQLAEVRRKALEEAKQIINDYMLKCEQTGSELADKKDATSERMYWRADGAADALEVVIDLIRNLSDGGEGEGEKDDL